MRIGIYCLGLMMCLCVPMVQAAEYQVDMIVFERLDPAKGPEMFPKIVGKPQADDPVRKVSPLPQEASKLASLLSVLEEKGYRTLYQISWQQPIAVGEPPSDVHIQGGQVLDYDHNETEVYQIDGFVSVSVPENLIKLKVDLLIDKIRLTQTVFVKPDQLIYIDHPLVGAVLMISTLGSDSSSTDSDSGPDSGSDASDSSS